MGPFVRNCWIFFFFKSKASCQIWIFYVDIGCTCTYIHSYTSDTVF